MLAGEGDFIGPDIENLTGGAGDDTLRGTTGRNVFIGGAGVDTVTYADRTAAVNVSLDGIANDGTPARTMSSTRTSRT